MQWNKTPSLSALRAFEAAVRHRNLSKAAAELNVTHAAIAQHIRALESEFSTNLVQRQGRGIAPTPEGERLAEGLNQGFNGVIAAVDDMRQRQKARALRVSITPAFAAHWLMPRIGQFWAEYPDIQLDIKPDEKLVDLRQDGFDMAIRHGDGDWPGLEAEKLSAGDFWVVAHPDLIAGRVIGCLAELQNMTWIFDAQLREPALIAQHGGLDLETLKFQTLATNAMAISAAIAGHGVIIQPKTIVEGDVHSGKLTRICRIPQNERGYYIVTLPGRASADLTVFRSWLRRQASMEKDKEELTKP